VAIIMDGNGRWAKARLLPRIEGHRAGAKAVRKALRTAIGLGIPHLTLYTFSLENWQRPRAEVTELMKILRRHLLAERETMLREGIRLVDVGDRSYLPPEVVETLDRVEEDTAGGRNLTLALALSYGSRQDMDRTARLLAGQHRQGGTPVTAEAFGQRLCTAGLPPVDLLIRTSGECRFSNFLLWETRGAFFHVTDTFWPAFGARQFREAVERWREAVTGREGQGR
jgi:undecaprenyl diphosphate synthase